MKEYFFKSIGLDVVGNAFGVQFDLFVYAHVLIYINFVFS